jgi:hypothetical protein
MSAQNGRLIKYQTDMVGASAAVSGVVWGLDCVRPVWGPLGQSGCKDEGLYVQRQ